MTHRPPPPYPIYQIIGMAHNEPDSVRIALSVCQSDKQRELFLRRWFRGTKARRIAADPFSRGAFARDAKMIPSELGLWNRFQAGIA